MLPAPALAFLAGAAGALTAGAAALAGAAPVLCPSSTVTSYTFPFTVIA